MNRTIVGREQEAGAAGVEDRRAPALAWRSCVRGRQVDWPAHRSSGVPCCPSMPAE